MRRSFDVIIVGGGPAGAAAALQLARNSADVARRTLLLDAKSFPREKLCGGGLVPESDRLLAHLGVAHDVPSVPVHRVVFEYAGGRSIAEGRQFFRVVHRAAFDDALLREVRARGVEVRDAAAVVSLDRTSAGIRVETRQGERFDARIIIGADGSNSQVRRRFVGSVQTERFVALETLTPGHELIAGTPSDGETAVFDFQPAASGLRGYAWDFPSLRNGEPWMNRGLAAGARSSDVALTEVFDDVLQRRGVARRPDDVEGAGAPIYDATRPQSAERVLLAGDAVGLDPWFGEGISVALGTGILAGHAATEALESGRFGFEDHGKRIEQSAVGWMLHRKRVAAELFYPAAQVDGALGTFLPGNADAAVGGQRAEQGAP